MNQREEDFRGDGLSGRPPRCFLVCCRKDVLCSLGSFPLWAGSAWIMPGGNSAKKSGLCPEAEKRNATSPPPTMM